MNPLAQRQRLTALVPGAHPLARNLIPIPNGIPSVGNTVVTEPRSPVNGFHAAWFPQTVLESPQLSFAHTMVPTAAAATDSSLASFLNQNSLLQYLGDINSGLVSDSLNQYVGSNNSYQSKHTSNPYKQANIGHEGSKHSYSNNDEQSMNKKSKGDWNTKNLHSSPPLNNNMYRSSSTGSSNSKLSDSQNSAESEPQNVEPPNIGRLPQSPIVTHSSSMPHPAWPTMGTMPHPGLTQTPPRPIGFEARWLLSNANIRSTSPYVSYSPSNWGSNSYISPPTSNVTPVGQKRKYTRFLPSPEPSPEGNYIGQHSQGIGGHYLDSWPKRKKKN